MRHAGQLVVEPGRAEHALPLGSRSPRCAWRRTAPSRAATAPSAVKAAGSPRHAPPPACPTSRPASRGTACATRRAPPSRRRWRRAPRPGGSAPRARASRSDSLRGTSDTPAAASALWPGQPARPRRAGSALRHRARSRVELVWPDRAPALPFRRQGARARRTPARSRRAAGRLLTSASKCARRVVEAARLELGVGEQEHGLLGVLGVRVRLDVRGESRRRAVPIFQPQVGRRRAPRARRRSRALRPWDRRPPDAGSLASATTAGRSTRQASAARRIVAEASSRAPPQQRVGTTLAVLRYRALGDDLAFCSLCCGVPFGGARAGSGVRPARPPTRTATPSTCTSLRGSVVAVTFVVALHAGRGARDQRRARRARRRQGRLGRRLHRHPRLRARLRAQEGRRGRRARAAPVRRSGHARPPRSARIRIEARRHLHRRPRRRPARPLRRAGAARLGAAPARRSARVDRAR